MAITRELQINYEKGKRLNIAVCAVTDIGLVRVANEDNFLIANLTNGSWSMPDAEQILSAQSQHNRTILAVADGNGRASAGREISQLTLETLRDSLFEYQQSSDYQTLNFSKQISLAIKTANEAIYKLQSDNKYRGIFSTLTVIGIEDGLAYIAQVGETRAYLIRGEKIVQLTEDQTIYQSISRPFNYDPDKPYGHFVLLNAIGAMPESIAIFHSLELADSDLLLVTSDGLTKTLKDEEIVKVIRESADIDLACAKLINAVNEKGSPDNITCMLASITGDLPTELEIMLKQLSKKTFMEYMECEPDELPDDTL